MRPSTVYFSVALAAQALGLPGVLPDAKAYAVNTLSQVENVAKELEISTPNIFNQEENSSVISSSHLEERGLLDRVGAFIVATANAVFPVTIGAYTWTSAIWNTAQRCFESTFDCLFGIADSVFGVWRTAYANTGGINKRGLGRPLVHAMTDRDNGTGVHWEFHVPFGQHKRLIQVIRNEFEFNGNHTFRHVATVYRHDVETHQLFYRHAHPDDLGKENDGTYHHIRANYTGSPPSDAVSRRAESNMDHVVGDYLWKDGDSTLFNDIHNEDNIVGDVGTGLANWMEQNNSEASCASIRTFVSVSEGGKIPKYEDQGVFAYGWNDKPFGFNGRAGGWIDQCN